jgi:3,4-dihydroxy-9,10-secoandrosta-1,3,5(10)-triene-9,17-dione 4,5-dioxygenase
MAEMGSMDEVGYCMDRVKAAGLHIFASLGRHANDEMVSFYFFAPGGIGFEVGYDGKQVKDWSKFKPTKSKIGDLWGHEYDFPMPEA